MPATAFALLIVALAAQITLAWTQPGPVARASALDPPPAGPSLAFMRGFDALPAAHLLTLYLQAFDNQPGISVPFRELDYTRVRRWLLTVLELDPAGQYPLLMATQLYGQVTDPARQQQMLEFAYEQFFADPDGRWPWLAHSAIMSKHRLKNLPQALKFARAIADKSSKAPAWARQMHIFLLEDLGEYDAAKILLGGLLASETVTDQHERILLLDALERVEEPRNRQVRRLNDAQTPPAALIINDFCPPTAAIGSQLADRPIVLAIESVQSNFSV